ncbi:SDR family NAD(P)-dependent oxidoreductase [Actinomycetospora sp. TBRC 11914]|uniref:SDR family NAD(P)-dependent oxidoreductase n=1 Tax=Actinomycetospora sp. TBRC 11914 TaxID=2729387 RepID=UPI00145D436D|nr:SDR family NAD(P)-dependent oxidoreductase [Actinomycetospora sp. TBRC 11914]NMO90689.1 SDR family NAD(P)-dependent oxidoreductase [Actinomycetospora sp. TBRC 11914]
MTSAQSPTILIVGASRGLGHAMAAELAKKDWRVTGTVRPGSARTALHDLADEYPDRVDLETVDITDPEGIAALRTRLADRTFDVLFVNAGTTNDEGERIGDVSTDEFVRVMITNSLSPMRVVESFSDLVPPTGLIGAMTSGQGSVANNTTGYREVYRGSKAALNMFMRSVAARESESRRAFVVMAPGWVQTALGGPGARLTIEESVPRLVEVLLAKRERPGIEYLDYLGRTVPW